MAYANDIQIANTGLAARFSNFVKALTDGYARYTVYRTTQIELEQLSDRELNDLGMSRGDIKSIAYDAAYRA